MKSYGQDAKLSRFPIHNRDSRPGHKTGLGDVIEVQPRNEFCSGILGEMRVQLHALEKDTLKQWKGIYIYILSVCKSAT